MSICSHEDTSRPSLEILSAHITSSWICTLIAASCLLKYGLESGRFVAHQFFSSMEDGLWRCHFRINNRLDLARIKWTSPHSTSGKFPPTTLVLDLPHLQQPLHLHAFRQRMEPIRSQSQASSRDESHRSTTFHVSFAATIQIWRTTVSHIRYSALASFTKLVSGASSVLSRRRARGYLYLHFNSWILMHSNHHRYYSRCRRPPPCYLQRL